MHACTHAHVHTCIYAYMHTNIHTYIHTERERESDQYSIGQQTRALGCAVTKAYTWRHETEMCADSTTCEYIPRIHGGSQFVVV